MIKIYKPNKNYYSCQVCGCHKAEVEQDDVFAIELMNSNGQGTRLHLCKDCCKELRSLLKSTQLKDLPEVNGAELKWHIAFDNPCKRDDFDLTCSCGALYRFECPSDVDYFVKGNFYCSVCGRKWKKNLD